MNVLDEKTAYRPIAFGVAAFEIILTVCLMTACSPNGDGNSKSNKPAIRYADDSKPVLPAPEAQSPPRSPTKPHYKAIDIDFSFAEEGLPYRAKIVEGINRTVHDNDRCASIMTSTLVPAEDPFSRKRPIFQIVCKTPDEQPFPVRFNANDVVSKDIKFSAASIIKEDTAKRACEDTAKQSSSLKEIAFSPFSMETSFLIATVGPQLRSHSPLQMS